MLNVLDYNDPLKDLATYEGKELADLLVQLGLTDTLEGVFTRAVVLLRENGGRIAQSVFKVNFALKLMHFVSPMMDFLFKMMNFQFNMKTSMMNFVLKTSENEG